ncbi:hypothetical protein [Rhizobium aegyptiacum]|uniref:hypothetical protein n=1 Tax=Rhizobium aegyptiacum TaxID=1764550 RepID=UPI001FDA01BF|nr:hypothetical protein [Rhizobium aegyptiacum]
MRKCGGGFIIHTGNRPREVGMGEILALTLNDSLQFHIHFVQTLGVGGDQVEEVAVDEAIEISGQPDCCLFAKTGKAVDLIARPDFD